MKKIINGKAYDTTTAKEMAMYSSPGSSRDFNHYVETLYLKKTGEYFLHGVGGPMTRYAETIGQNQWSGGQRIVPLTYQAAQEWAGKHLEGDEYEAIFGAVVEEEGRETVTWSLSSALVARLRREAQEAGVTVGALVESKLT